MHIFEQYKHGVHLQIRKKNWNDSGMKKQQWRYGNFLTLQLCSELLQFRLDLCRGERKWEFLTEEENKKALPVPRDAERGLLLVAIK
ncbi:MAG: hypothetical protein N2V78_07830 [Methanophagales archaeon]|nr:hypothetical protein [Methanophagales archaeon]